MCPYCHSLDQAWPEASGAGVVYSYSLLHHPQHSAFDYPILAALIELEEKVRIVSNLVDVEPRQIHIGMSVQVAFEPTADGYAVPVFRPHSGGG